MRKTINKYKLDYIRGYISAIFDGKTKKGITSSYGFGEKGLGIYAYKNFKLVFFIPDDSD